MKDYAIALQQEVADATMILQEEVFNFMSGNLSTLDAEYTALISKIQTAIIKQKELNAVKATQRYLWWPVTAGMPYLVGENPDGSINPQTTEMIVPNHNGSVIPANKLQSMLQKGNDVNNSKARNFNGDINMSSMADFESWIEKKRFTS